MCRLDARICNSKQRWNEDKCRCECKDIIDKERCDTGFIWNPSVCDCECDKSCDVGEYLDYQNSKCRLKIVDKLDEECSEFEMIYNGTLNAIPLSNHGKVCNSCRIYIVLFAIFSIISVSISSIFIYFHWYLKK